MQVCRANFDAVLPELKELLRTCDFYAIDQEMTGISVPTSEGTESPLATLEQVYPAKRAAAQRYNGFQIGICTYHTEASAGGKPVFAARPFNFWLCNRGNSADDVQLSMSAIEFLLGNSMDFQYWLREGLSYANDAKVDRLSTSMAVDAASVKQRATADELEWADAAFERVSAWYKNAPVQDDGTPAPLTADFTHLSATADAALFYRLQDGGVNVNAVPDLLARVPAWKRSATTFTRAESTDANATAHTRAVNAAADNIRRSLGFREVWDVLVELKGKPQLGHNYSSDLMFLEAMHGAALPETFGGFLETVHSHFPRIVDTKTLAAHISVGAPFVSTSLEPLYQALEGLPDTPFSIRLPLGFESYSPAVIRKAPRGSQLAVAHQGAYDAFMTGVVYLHFLLREPERTAKLENLVSVFGSAFTFRLGSAASNAEEILPGAFYVLKRPPLLGRRQIDASLRTEEELGLSDIERRKTPAPFALWSCPESSWLFVLHLKPGNEDRVEKLPPGVVATPLQRWLSEGAPKGAKMARAEASR